MSDTPARAAVSTIASRAILKLVSDGSPALDDFGPPDRSGARTAGPRAIVAAASALIDVQAEDAKRAQGKPATDHEWAELIATFARGRNRRSKLTKVGRELRRRHGEETTLALLTVLNLATCRPPLAAHEVEDLCRWVLDRHDERRPS